LEPGEHLQSWLVGLRQDGGWNAFTLLE